jgi:hypothetical protein
VLDYKPPSTEGPGAIRGRFYADRLGTEVPGSSHSGRAPSYRLMRQAGWRRGATLYFSDSAALTAVADDANNLSERMLKLMFQTPGGRACSALDGCPLRHSALPAQRLGHTIVTT